MKKPFGDDQKLKREILRMEKEINRKAKADNIGMRLRFFPVNNAWAFVFGKGASATPTRFRDFPLFFDSKEEAIDAAHACTLVVDRAGWVTSDPNRFE